MNVLLTLFSGLFASFLVGCFFLILSNIQKIEELVAILRALKNESDYNSIHRGSGKSPFQLSWLEKVLSVLEFYKQCDENFIKNCLESFELAKDANLGNLEKRGILISNVQQKFSDISSSVDKMLTDLVKNLSFWNYIKKFVIYKFINRK